ncbi:SPFH domain / Band 7 family protein [bacterium BMS3Abin14]|nr:SPFH domain / Band 7 family protein [bacterium BMS3Abin14]
MGQMDNNSGDGPFRQPPVFKKPEFKLPDLPAFKMQGKGSKILMSILALLILAGLAYNMLLVYVGPNQYGIKEVKIGIRRGIQKKIYKTGLQFVLPMGFERMYLFPRDLQVFEMTNTPTRATRLHRYTKAAHIQTSDGFFVDVDLAIIYHIIDPYKVITTVGPGTMFEDNGIIPKAEPVLRQALGELSTEQFYNSPLRYEKSLKAQKILDAELRPKGIAVDDVLVRYFRYSDEIQKNIEAKKLQDQLVFKNQAEKKAAAEGAKVKKVIAEGEADIKVKLQEGDAYQVKRLAERDLYVRSKHAAGDLQVKLAEARKTALKNAALRGAGSERLVGLSMAEVYKGLDLIVLSSDGKQGVNPLDLQRTLQMFGVRKGARP